MHITATILGGLLLVSCLPNAVLAQTASLPAVTTAFPAKQNSAATVKEPLAATASCQLLSAPFLSPAALARLKQKIVQETQAYAFVKSGDEAAKIGDWSNAQNAYQQALGLSPEHGLGHQLALYGLIAYCRATGDTAKGLDYSRQAIYHHGSAAEGFFENNTEKLMQFALLLNKTGQSGEAMTVYNHAAYALDYQDSQYNGGKPHLKVLLPEVTAAPNLPTQVQYTPEHLQALADTALAHEEAGFGSEKEAYAHTQEAVKLYPDSAVTHYYRGEVISGPVHSAEAKTEYQKALDLGDDATVAAAKERMSVLR